MTTVSSQFDYTFSMRFTEIYIFVCRVEVDSEHWWQASLA